eukprot:g14319.t1 g14319   contig9:1603150-1604731(+)
MAAQRLLTALESLSPTSNDSNSPTNGNALLLLSEWSDDLEKDLLSAASTGTSAEEVEASHASVNDAASVLHHSLLCSPQFLPTTLGKNGRIDERRSAGIKGVFDCQECSPFDCCTPYVYWHDGRAVQKITADELPNNEYAQGLLEVLVATLSWALRSEPTFPGDEYDRRPDLVLEILRSLFAMDAGLSSNSSHNKDTMTRIGIILCELLQYPNSDMRVYQCKLAVVALLLNAPDDYSEYLAVNRGIIPLIDIMAYQLSVVVIERTGSSAEDAAAAVPILLVLRKLAQASSSVLKLVQDEVFPPDAEEAFKEKAESEIMKKQSEGTVRAKNMAPLDAPRGTLRWKLIRLMTWTESNVKRSASELLWTLCDEDSTQFVLRTGFGNAIHFLGMKGCVNLPTGVAI